MFRWNDKTMTWMTQASMYTGQADHLAAFLLPHLKAGGTVADLGCGLGLTDLALAPHFEKLTCVDIDPQPLARLRAKAPANVEAVQADSAALTDTWDDVLLLSYGRLADHAEEYLALCRHAVVALVRASKDHTFGSGAGNHTTVGEVSAALTARGVPFRVYPAELECGQPLRSLADAVNFVTEYGQDEPTLFLQEHLVDTGRPD